MKYASILRILPKNLLHIGIAITSVTLHGVILYLYNYYSKDNIENIFSWDPTDRQWWITGFNPEYVGNVDAASQVMIGSVDFSQFTNSEGDNEMYEALELNYKDNKDKSRYTIFDDTNHMVWICWYDEGL